MIISAWEILLGEYLDALRLKRRAKSSIDARKHRIKNFLIFLKECHVKDINDVRRTHLVEYQKYMRVYRDRFEKNISIASQNDYISAIKQFLKYLKREGYIIFDPSQDIELAKTPRRLPKNALPWREIKKILNAPDITTPIGYRDRTIFEVFYSSGIRRSEIRTLKLKDADYEEGYLRVIGKGDKERVVPLGEIACRYVENYVKGVRPHLLKEYKSEYLFFGRRGRLMTTHLLFDRLRIYVKKSNIQKSVTFHTFRRSCATGMIRNNANVMHVKALLGHDSMDAIQSYIDLSIVDLKKAHKKTHPREVSEK